MGWLFKKEGSSNCLRVDIEDCLALIKAKKKEINFKDLESRFKETASFDVSQTNVLKNFEHFMKLIKKEGIQNE